jgi:hypothetical protein
MPLLLLSLLALCACRGTDTPVKAYMTFHEQMKKGSYKEAYAALSQGTRDALTARTQALKEASGGSVKATPEELLFTNSPTPSDVTDVTLAREEGDVATVRMLSAGQVQEVRLVREASGWKIDLSEFLKP